MRKLTILLYILIAGPFIRGGAQTMPVTPGQLKPEWQKLLLELGTNFFTVVKENEVDLDSSLIHVAGIYKLSRLPIALEGIESRELSPNNEWFDERRPQAGIQQLNTLKKRPLAVQLLTIGAYYAFEPASNANANSLGTNYLNRALQMGRQLNDNELILVSQRLLGKIMLKQMNLQAADDMLKKVVSGYAANKNQSAQARTYQWWALYTPVTTTSTPLRLTNIENAIQLFRQTGNNEDVINALINNSYLLMLKYDLNGAFNTAHQADSIVNTIGFPYAHYLTGVLTVITMFQGKFGEPLTHALQSAENAEKLKDSIVLPYYYGQISEMYNNEDEFNENAIIWNIKGINCFLLQKEPCYLALSNIVSELVRHNRTEEARNLIQKVYANTPPQIAHDSLFYFLALGAYNQSLGSKEAATAFNFYSKADAIEKKLEQQGMDIRKAALLFDFGSLLFDRRKYAEARPYIQQFLEQPSNAANSIYTKTKAWAILTEIDSVLGNKDAMLNDLRNYSNILQESYRVSKTKLAEELQVKYATEQKTNQIKILQQQAELEQANLSNANQVKNATIGGILSLLIIAALLYRQTRLKQKNNDTVTKKNELLQRLVDEKEWLLKEIHHRVKNNLYTVICLLESQAAYLDNDALKAIENSQHRIYAMSLIHQKLYQSDDIKVIDMKMYMAEFTDYLVQSFGSPENINISVDTDDIMLDISQAIPVSLIVNEGVTNSFKYAFPGHKKGEINISLKRLANELLLTISDSGIGFKYIPGEELNTLGLELIKGLSKDLRGHVSFEMTKGTSIRVHFLIDLIEERLHANLNEAAL